MTVETFVARARDISNIVFFAVTGTLAILTYLHARKNLFVPLKTEIFKQQIATLNALFLLLQDKRETDLISLFDEEEIVRLNSFRVFSIYADVVFPRTIKMRQSFTKDLDAIECGAIVSESFMKKQFEVIPAFEGQTLSGVKRDPVRVPRIVDTTETHYVLAGEVRTLAADTFCRTSEMPAWQTYRHEIISFTVKNQQARDDFRRISRSPLLPQVVKRQVDILQNNMQKNLVSVGMTLSAFSQELPRLYPDVESLIRFSDDGVWTAYDNQRCPLEPTARSILDVVRRYLRVDQLTPR